MGNDVYANGREIACKAGMGKAVAAFPDVCLSPPSPPAGPIPVPYPLTAMASDTSEGSKSVEIGGQEVMLKSDSNFKKCMGDEAATKSFGSGVITHNLGGKVYFCIWSMDVKIEGANAVRHLDLVTQNHMSQVGQTPPCTFAQRSAIAAGLTDCAGDVSDAQTACTPWKQKAKCPNAKNIRKANKAMAKAKKLHGENSPQHNAKIALLNAEYDAYAEEISKSECHKKLRCLLSTWKPSRCCKTGQTPHHLIEKSSFFKDKVGGTPMPGCSSYKEKKAACVCVEGNSQYVATHGIAHTIGGTSTLNKVDSKGNVSFQQGCNTAKETMEEVFKKSGCNPKCIEAQLKKSHEQMASKRQKKINAKTRIKGVSEGHTGDQAVKDGLKKAGQLGCR